MLDSAGFMEPLRRTNQAVPDCQYLSKGRYNIINRPPTNEEDQLMEATRSHQHQGWHRSLCHGTNDQISRHLRRREHH